eukprot:CAMPEP_0113528576 /NCGR_PEP_ID=MMETSP0015_2-20120614/1920_1 /TAXON_ID=2838 /ORGANISM="Odontella" /LENGTH=254 /DNA_ID=CAMNT_0000427121 /DNA_START=97 /DNA_END=861 /DNA_ORIENTATION=- /assembly_acc=CAM_ASM_000160
MSSSDQKDEAENTAAPPMEAEPAVAGNGAADDDEGLRKSALRDNIDRKGKNAYYYAHSSTATGPKWDGKPQPKLLGRQTSDVTAGGGAGSAASGQSESGFHYHKSNITTYSFSDEGSKVRLYVGLPGLLEKCPDDSCVELESTSFSFCLVVKNYPEEGQERCLSFGGLWGEIEGATFRRKKDRIVLTLKKKKVETTRGEEKEGGDDLPALEAAEGTQEGEGKILLGESADEKEEVKKNVEYEEWGGVAAKAGDL